MNKKTFFRVVKSLTTPVEAELPFFCLFLLAIAFMPLRYFPSPLIHGHWQLVANFLFENFPRAVVIAYLFTLLVYFTRSRAVRIACYAFGTALFAICLFLLCVFRMSLQPNIIMLIAETNYKESTEFLSSFLFSAGGIVTLLVMAIYIAAVLLLERRKAQLTLWWSKLRWKPLMNTVLCVFVCVGLVQCRIYGETVTAKRVEKINMDGAAARDAVTSLFLSLYSVVEVNQQMKHAVDVSLAATVPPQTFDDDSLNVVYVIGESYIRKHSHLYGYSLPTTPHLDEERRKGNLFVFEDVVAPYNSTSTVMKNTLCCNSLRNHEKWYEKPYFPVLFKKAGFDVLFWDNQLEGSSSQAFYAFTLESFMYNEQLREASYSQLSERSYPYDAQIVEDFSRKARHRKSHQLVMFHLMGQHLIAVDRYPHEKPFMRFSKKDIKLHKDYLDDAKRQMIGDFDKRQMIADYDNATFYNDYVLKQIIDLYRNENTVLIYFSDHGEEIFDYRDSYGRVKFDPESQPEGVHYQYEVPFMIWCSDKYMAAHPDVVKCIKQSLRKPFRTDDICQVVFHLAHLKTEYYRPKYDLLSPEYVKYRRTVEEGMRYD